MRDYSKLIGRIAEKGLTKGELAKMIGISDATLRGKLHDRYQFRLDEIEAIGKILDIDKDDFVSYFFA